MDQRRRTAVEPGRRQEARLRASHGVVASYMHERSDRHRHERTGHARGRERVIEQPRGG